MRKIREILRLKAAAVTDRAIAASVGCSRSTAQECLKRAREAGIAWPLPDEMDDAALEARLYPHAPVHKAATLAFDFTQIARELTRKHLTRRQLWREYRQANPKGLSYTSFCVQFKQWRKTTGAEATLTQSYVPGEYLFVDYSGDPAYWVERLTGERIAAQLFVCAWGFSHKLFAIATPTQKTEDWLTAHAAALEAFGCAPAVFVPDNASALVRKVCKYDPDLNPEYHDLARHYGVTILPARARKPRDKAKVENAVLIAQRRVLAALRDAVFFSLAELNLAIAAVVATINAERFQKRDGSRNSVFEEHERAAAKALPRRPYEYASWHRSVVHRDHHIEIGRAYYSVPYPLIGQTLDVRLGARMVEIFKAGTLIAAHGRASRRYQRTTLEAHRPPEHRAYLALGFDQLLDQAKKIGPNTAAVLAKQALAKKHIGETIRSAQGILRLAGDFSAQALERAAGRALELQVYTYRALRDLIQQPHQLPLAAPSAATAVHENVRGAKYFH